jgi:Gluconate 2-dehydrogenase subunit 3
MRERPGLNRREAIRCLVEAGLATAGTAHLAEAFAAARPSRAAGSDTAAYHPRFFEGEEYATVAELAASIIPSDETPGAREARVAEWIDFLVSESDNDRQRLYRDGLGRLAARCRESGRGAFPTLPGPAREEAVRELEAADPVFFRAVKEDTVFGFYTSEVGLRELGADGHPFHSECPGCTHPAHLNGTLAVPDERRPRVPR